MTTSNSRTNTATGSNSLLTRSAKKVLFCAAAAAFTGFVLKGTLMSALMGGTLYAATKTQYVKAKAAGLRSPAVSMALGLIPLIWFHLFFNIPDQINRLTAPIKHTQSRLLQDAGEKLYTQAVDNIVTCESVHKFAPFGRRGTKTGDECLSLVLEKRDGLNFTAIAKFTSEPTPRRVAFTKETWLFRSAGYRNAIALNEDLTP